MKKFKTFLPFDQFDLIESLPGEYDLIVTVANVPRESEKPVEPEKLVVLENPVEQVEQVEPEKPVKPGEPEKPVKPVEPEKPVKPGKHVKKVVKKKIVKPAPRKVVENKKKVLPRT